MEQGRFTLITFLMEVSDSVEQPTDRVFEGNECTNGSLLLTPKLTEPFICSETSRGSIYYDNTFQNPMFCNALLYNSSQKNFK